MNMQLRVLVCIKQVADIHTPVSLKETFPSFDPKTTVYVINRYDEYALEEALQLKDCGLTKCVHTLSIGPMRTQKALRRSLEMGADAAFHILTDDDVLCTPLDIAHNIALFANNRYDIIFTGVMSQDSMNQQTSQLIASILQYNYATGVIEVAYIENTVYITREIDIHYSMKYALTLPCVIAIQSSKYRPRYPSVSNVLRARKQEIPVLEFTQSPRKYHNVVYYTLPHKKTECTYFHGDITTKVRELYTVLHNHSVL